MTALGWAKLAALIWGFLVAARAGQHLDAGERGKALTRALWAICLWLGAWA